MKKYRRNARTRTCESLEGRQMLAADLGVDLGIPTDPVDTPAVISSSSDTDTGSENSQVEIVDSSNLDAIYSSDVVLGWNNLFNELLVDDEVTQNPGYASRSMAMLNLAIYDAVSIASGNAENTFYDYETSIGPNANINLEVAASQAAYTVLSALYPDQQGTIDSYYGGILDDLRQNSVNSDSLTLGTEIGNAILAERANDGSDAVVEYTYVEGIGYFYADPLNPDVPVWGPGWGEVETFVIDSAEDFAPESTPAITSEEYAISYNEVKELGSVDSATRTADETEAGIFWAYDREGLGTPLSLFNDVLETIAIQEGNTLLENAALYAQASVAMADAAIVAWHTKFDEEFWRPVTAIHSGDADGNELTEGDSEWVALGAPDGGDDIIGFTPQFPTYISGHATFGGALFASLQEFYGTDDIAFELSSNELEILMENPELQEAYGLDLDDSVRSFDSFSQAMAENGRSRVYLGIHFDFDDLVGQEVGSAVASAVASEFVVATNDEMNRKGPRPDGDHNNERRQRGPRGPRGMVGEGPMARINPNLLPPLSDRLQTNADLVQSSEEIDSVLEDRNRNSEARFDRSLREKSDRERDRPSRDQMIEAMDEVFSELGENELSPALEQIIHERSTHARRRG